MLTLKIFALGLLAGTSALAQAPGDWPYTRANPEMTGVSKTDLHPPLTLAWRFA
ncbi:MAG: hypothetical protein JWO94_1053, partial [Verrucomicrobiaceae bacterium]|nr:hypothetical protein [Verrucomicrobiaceae bacterium]